MYSSPNIIRINKSRRKKLVGHVAFMGENRNAYKDLVGKPAEQRPLGRPIYISQHVDPLLGSDTINNAY